MKKFLIILLALAIGAVAGYFFLTKVLNKDSYSLNIFERKASPTFSKVTAENYQEPFMWGINVNPSPVRKYSLEMWNKQMKLVSGLGANWIRLTYGANVEERLEIFDEMVDSANKKGFSVFLSLDSSEPVTSLKKPYDDGYQVASEVAEHYKGKIKYYQILNEVGGTVVKGWEYSGENESDFDPDKYQNVREWSRGAISAIRKIDPDAYVVLDFHWTHYAIVEMLIRDGVDFDILGWNWYADMGMMGEKELSDGTLLIDKLKSYNKPIILAEVNSLPTKTAKEEAKQAEFIEQIADWAYNSGIIKGFFIHELTDIAPTKTREEGYFGIVRFKKAPDGGYTFGEPKEAYDTYKDIIAKYSQ